MYARQNDEQTAYSPEACMEKNCESADLAWGPIVLRNTISCLGSLGPLADVMLLETIQTSLWDLSHGQV